MNLFTRTLVKYLKALINKNGTKIQNIVEAINNKEKETKSLTEADFRRKQIFLKKCSKWIT